MARSRCCQCGAVLEREASTAASAAAVARRAPRGSGSVAGAAGGSGPRVTTGGARERN